MYFVVCWMLVCASVGEGFSVCNPNNNLFLHTLATVSGLPYSQSQSIAVATSLCVKAITPTGHAYVTAMTHIMCMSRLWHTSRICHAYYTHTSYMCHAYHTRHAYVMAVATRSCMCHGEPPVQTKQGTTGSNPIGHTRSRIRGVRSPQDSVCHVTTYSAAHRCSIKRMCRMTLRYGPCGVVARRRKVSELKGITRCWGKQDW